MFTMHRITQMFGMEQAFSLMAHVSWSSSLILDP